ANNKCYGKCLCYEILEKNGRLQCSEVGRWHAGSVSLVDLLCNQRRGPAGQLVDNGGIECDAKFCRRLSIRCFVCLHVVCECAVAIVEERFVIFFPTDFGEFVYFFVY